MGKVASACAAALLAAPAIAQPGYRHLPLAGSEVVIADAGDYHLHDWSQLSGDPSRLLVSDGTGRRYVVRVSGHGNCRFAGEVPVGTYGVDLVGAFARGAWVQNSAYPYQRCLVRSVKLQTEATATR